jgi:ionotropic glutamate receptor
LHYNGPLRLLYATHGDYKTRLILTTRDSKRDLVGAAAAGPLLMMSSFFLF